MDTKQTLLTLLSSTTEPRWTISAIARAAVFSSTATVIQITNFRANQQIKLVSSRVFCCPRAFRPMFTGFFARKK